MIINKKTSTFFLIGALAIASRVSSKSNDITHTLPDLGTTAGAILSIDQEKQLGDFYMRQLRAHAPLLNDPLLMNYINHVGQQLTAYPQLVRTPFHFHLLHNEIINAFAFFGGHVILHSGLFRYIDNESQLASVMAHEISHVTQRHLARAMEEKKSNAPLAWASALGSLLLVMAHPQAGMTALTASIAGFHQGMISFTQSNEQEADRIGVQLLQRAGFDPQAMPDFLQKIADRSRFSSAPPEILLTHPLPDSRLADMRNRVGQMSAIKVLPSADFYMAKIRLLVMYDKSHQYSDLLLKQWVNGNLHEQLAAQYGKALQSLESKNVAHAQQIIAPLLLKHPDNLWLLDIMTDIDVRLNNASQAIKRLQASDTLTHHSVLQVNLANALLRGKQPETACQLLHRYTWTYPDDPNGWELLAQAAEAANKHDEALAAHAEDLALKGDFNQAIKMLISASAMVPTASLKQARYDARIDQLRQLEKNYRQFAKS